MTSIKISPFPGKDAKNFKNISKTRSDIIEDTSPSELKDTSIDILTKELKPKYQRLYVKRIERVNDDIKIFYFSNADGKKLAPFRPGQYITILYRLNNEYASRSYSLSSSPNEALINNYRISVKRVNNGLVSNYMLDMVKEGDVLISLCPSGEFTPSTIRDRKHLVGLAFNSGISPLVSIAKAIYEKSIDKEITIFYVTDIENEYIYKRELDELASNINIKVIYLLKGRDSLTVNLIKNYVQSKFTVFACGDQEFYDILLDRLSILNLGPKDFRFQMFSVIQRYVPPVVEEIVEIGEPEPVVEETSPETEEENKEEHKRGRKKKKEETEEEIIEEAPTPVVEAPVEPEVVEPVIYNIKVFTKSKEFNILCREDQTILNALETSNIAARSKCKHGTCGYCRSLLLWGDIKIQDGLDARKYADKLSNYIHPCVSFPASDITIKLDI